MARCTPIISMLKEQRQMNPWSSLTRKPSVLDEFHVQWEILSRKNKVDSFWGTTAEGVFRSPHACVLTHVREQTHKKEHNYFNHLILQQTKYTGVGYDIRDQDLNIRSPCTPRVHRPGTLKHKELLLRKHSRKKDSILRSGSLKSPAPQEICQQITDYGKHYGTKQQWSPQYSLKQ